MIESLIASFVYDCLKAGVKHISQGYFEEQICANSKVDMSGQKLDKIYEMVNQIYSEVRDVPRGYVTRDDLVELIREHIKIINPENRKRNLEIYIERGDIQYQKENYDSAIKQYEEALFYADGKEEKAIIYWNIFLCYLMIDRYYCLAVECNSKCYDIYQLYHDNDFNDRKTVADIKRCFGVGKYEAESIFSMLSGVSCSFAKRKYVVSRNAYTIGQKAYSIMPNTNWKEILDGCVIRE